MTMGCPLGSGERMYLVCLTIFVVWQGTEIPTQRQAGRAPGLLDKEGCLITGPYPQEQTE